MLPVDTAFSEQQAFVVDGNRIVAVGSNESMLSLAGANARRVDLDGRTVLPGFVEPHIHLMLLALTADWLDSGR